MTWCGGSSAARAAVAGGRLPCSKDRPDASTRPGEARHFADAPYGDLSGEQSDARFVLNRDETDSTSLISRGAARRGGARRRHGRLPFRLRFRSRGARASAQSSRSNRRRHAACADRRHRHRAGGRRRRRHRANRSAGTATTGHQRAAFIESCLGRGLVGVARWPLRVASGRVGGSAALRRRVESAALGAAQRRLGFRRRVLELKFRYVAFHPARARTFPRLFHWEKRLCRPRKKPRSRDQIMTCLTRCGRVFFPAGSGA